MGDEHERDEDLDPWVTTHWEQQCIEEVEAEPDLEPRIHTENDLATQKLWCMFQNTATAIAQLYKDRQQGVSLWLPFQNAAGAVTNLYKESVDTQKRCFDLGIQCGYQRRNKELLSWVKKRRRNIRREDLLAYLAGKSPPPRCRSSPRTRLTLDRSAPRLGQHQEPVIAASPTPEEEMQIFTEALAISSLSGAMSDITVGFGSSPLASGHSRRRSTITDLSSFIRDEFNRHCESRKRGAPTNDVIMDSPTHKRSRLV